MKRKLILSGSALLSLLCVAGVQAEEGVSGHIEATGKSIDVNGNKAKFNEYSDADSGVTGGVEMKYDGESGFLNFTADEIARDTQSFNLEAGQHGKFKLDAFYKEIQHNNTFDAKTFYTGVGTNNLTTTATSASLPTNTATWPSTFDYAVSRDQYGAGIKLNMMKPFFADFSVSQEDRKGIKAAGVYGGSYSLASVSGSNPTGRTGVSIELPEPVDYQTNTFKAEIGYGEDPFFVSLSYLQSNFDNANQYLYFTSLAPSLATTSEFLTLPPNNDYSKFAFKGRVKMPMSSTLAVNLSKSKAESEFNLASAYNTAGVAYTNTLSDPLFNGQVDTLSYGMILTSSPVDFLDAKFHYSGYEKENKSDEILSTRSSSGLSFDNHLFDYDKTSYGVEAGFKLPAHVKLTPYYKNVKVERHRGDLPETDDDIYGLNARWTGLEKLAVHGGYERMNRDADWQQIILVAPSAATATSPDGQTTANAIEPYIRRFDAAPQDRDTFKIGLDIFPAENLNIGLGYRHKKSNYTDTVLGLREEKSSTFDVSADYTVGNVTLAGYLSYDKTEHSQNQRRLQYAGAPATPATNILLVSPIDTLDANDNNYNWQADTESITYDYGASVEVALVPNVWRVKVQFDHVKSDGFADYTYTEGAPSGYTNDTVDSENWDDYTKDSLQLKLVYEATKTLTLTGVYAYEDYEYNDQFSDGYRYVVNTSTTVNPTYSYLTGAGMDPNYTANVFFMTAKYKF